MFAYTSTKPASYVTTWDSSSVISQTICRYILHTGHRWPGIYSTNIVLDRQNRTNEEKRQGDIAMYIKRGTGCKFRQTLKFLNLIPIYHDYDIQI